MRLAFRLILLTTLLGAVTGAQSIPKTVTLEVSGSSKVKSVEATYRRLGARFLSFAWNRRDGELAAIDVTKNKLVVFPRDYFSNEEVRPREIDTVETPLQVLWKPVGDRSYYVVFSKAKGAVACCDASTLKETNRKQISDLRAIYGSNSAGDSRLYFQADTELRAMRVPDLSGKELVSKVESVLGVSADGRFVYVNVRNLHQRNQLHASVIRVQPEGFQTLLSRLRMPGEEFGHLDGSGGSIVTRKTVLSPRLAMRSTHEELNFTPVFGTPVMGVS